MCERECVCVSECVYTCKCVNVCLCMCASEHVCAYTAAGCNCLVFYSCASCFGFACVTSTRAEHVSRDERHEDIRE